MTYVVMFDRAESGRLIVAPTKRPWVIKILVGLDLDSPQAKMNKRRITYGAVFTNRPLLFGRIVGADSIRPYATRAKALA